MPSRLFMLTYIKTLRPLLRRSTKVRLVGVAAAAVGLAALEALGLVLILPLIQLIAGGATTTMPASAQWWSHLLGIDQPLRLAAVLGGLVFASFLGKGIAAVLYLRWNLGLVLSTEASMASQLLGTYLRMPYPLHLERNTAEMQRTVHESVRRVYSEALTAVLGGAADAVMIGGIALVLIVAEPGVALVAGIYFLFVALGYQRLIHGRTHAAARGIHDQTSSAYQVVQQSLGAIREVQLAHRQEHFVEQLHRSKTGMAKQWRTILLLMQVPRYYLEGALVVGFGLMSVVVFHLRSTVEATAVLGLFLAAGFRVLPSLNRVLVTAGTVKASLPALEQIKADLDLDAPQETGPTSPYLAPPSLELHGVSFRYADDAPRVLRDVSLTIDPGQWIAFVGPSGSGKSTLVDLMLGLLEPNAGHITIDGRPMAETRDRWQRSIGYVPQNIVILDDSLRANVAFGDDPATVDDQRVRDALAAAQLADVVDGLADGLDTRLGELGARLSGGQRQRVGLARALYRRPAVLVLDEATSALDSETEDRVCRSLLASRGDMTVITIAHRLSTIRNCDEIFVLADGRLAAQGGFDDLRARDTGFAELVRLSALTS